MCLIAMAVGKKHREYNPSCRHISPKRCNIICQRKKRVILTVCEKLLRHKRLTTRAISRKYRPKSWYRRRSFVWCVSGDNNEEVSVQPSNSLLGAMAPDNTTQYLMNLVYQDFSASDRLSAFDLHTETVRWSSCTSRDSDPYDLSLDFQQRDFEDMLRLTSGCCWPTRPAPIGLLLSRVSSAGFTQNHRGHGPERSEENWSVFLEMYLYWLSRKRTVIWIRMWFLIRFLCKFGRRNRWRYVVFLVHSCSEEISCGSSLSHSGSAPCLADLRSLPDLSLPGQRIRNRYLVAFPTIQLYSAYDNVPDVWTRTTVGWPCTLKLSHLSGLAGHRRPRASPESCSQLLGPSHVRQQLHNTLKRSQVVFDWGYCTVCDQPQCVPEEMFPCASFLQGPGLDMGIGWASGILPLLHKASMRCDQLHMFIGVKVTFLKVTLLSTGVWLQVFNRCTSRAHVLSLLNWMENWVI